jgi:catechol 2,3-dioxygenase-like lactoylglutathione lyase family enzyme
VKVERVDFVDIPTRDLERAIAFYRDVLQLPQNPRQPTEFEAGNVTLALWEPEDQGVEFPTSAAHGIALRVEDVAAARAELEAKGSSSSASATRGSATWRSSRIRTATR